MKLRSVFSPPDPSVSQVTMSDKPASMYREITNPAYTRREYITGIPGSKIAQHNMGDLQATPRTTPSRLA